MLLFLPLATKKSILVSLWYFQSYHVIFTSELRISWNCSSSHSQDHVAWFEVPGQLWNKRCVVCSIINLFTSTSAKMKRNSLKSPPKNANLNIKNPFKTGWTKWTLWWDCFITSFLNCQEWQSSGVYWSLVTESDKNKNAGMFFLNACWLP